jgi:hypothetical protein
MTPASIQPRRFGEALRASEDIIQDTCDAYTVSVGDQTALLWTGVYKTWHRFSANVYGTPMRAYIGMYATPEEAAKAHDE